MTTYDPQWEAPTGDDTLTLDLPAPIEIVTAWFDETVGGRELHIDRLEDLD